MAAVTCAAAPASPGAREERRRQALAGGYRLREAEGARVTIVAVGVMVVEACAAADELTAAGVPTDVVCLTSPDLVFRAQQARQKLHVVVPAQDAPHAKELVQREQRRQAVRHGRAVVQVRLVAAHVRVQPEQRHVEPVEERGANGAREHEPQELPRQVFAGLFHCQCLLIC